MTKVRGHDSAHCRRGELGCEQGTCLQIGEQPACAQNWQDWSEKHRRHAGDDESEIKRRSRKRPKTRCDCAAWHGSWLQPWRGSRLGLGGMVDSRMMSSGRTAT